MPARLHPRPPVDPAALNGTGGTMWTNLGFWESANRGDSAVPTNRAYPSAAAALARRVGAAANLKASDVLLDYACGFGDSLRLWVDEFSVRRVVGIEPDPSVCRVIDSRIRSWGFADRISVICASAEDTLPRGVADDVSAVVSVDAAYHFRTRNTWLRSLAADASAGLRLGLADFNVVAGSERSRRLRALAQLMRIPRENLMSARAIAVACEDAGLSVTSCESVGVQVLDGFVAHAPRTSMTVAVTRAAIAYARRARLLDYLVIGARI